VPKELTLREVCIEQMQRLNKTLGYPDNKLAMNDYCAALEVMETFEGVRGLMDDLTRTDLIRMPSAAAIRTMAYDRMRETLAQRASCEHCGGSGVVSGWYLLTYHGKSMQMRSSVFVSQDWDQAKALAEKIAAEPLGADRQQVLSAAKECQCRKARVLV